MNRRAAFWLLRASHWTLEWAASFIAVCWADDPTVTLKSAYDATSNALNATRHAAIAISQPREHPSDEAPCPLALVEER